MNTLYDFGQMIIEIRDAADQIEVKGAKNASLIAMIFQRCNDIISELNKIVLEQANNDGDGEKPN